VDLTCHKQPLPQDLAFRVAYRGAGLLSVCVFTERNVA
jgi:hypothetical protein